MDREGKFSGLTKYFTDLKVDERTMTFDQIEKIIETKLSDSAYKYIAYWSPSKTHTITKCWIDNGYKIVNLNIKEQQITFRKDDSIRLVQTSANKSNSISERNPVKRISQTIDLERVLLSIDKYYKEIESDKNARYLSWEHCYQVFQEAHNRRILTDEITDYLSLHLAFYLASWGMLRGSSFLLQKDYRVHIDIIKELYKPCYNNLWRINHIDLQAQKNMDTLISLIENVKAIYRVKRMNTKEVNTDISDILVSKVLLGTLGCVPAYDEYFKKGLSKYNITTQLLGKTSVKGLLGYYEKNETELEKIRKIISLTRKIEYPQMKILDMAFWQLGFDYKLGGVL